MSLDQPALADVTMAYAIALDGRASADDLAPGTALTGTVTITAGSTTADIVVPTEDDAVVEGPEDLRIVLANPSSNAEILDGEAIGTILDNDTLPVEVFINNITIDEEGETSESFEISLSSATTEDISVTWTIQDVTTTFGADFSGPLTGTATVLAGDTVATIDIPGAFQAVDDIAVEGSETFAVLLTEVTSGAASIADGEGLGTILDYDSANLNCGVSCGDPHYVTFDGVANDFQGVGEYILVEDLESDLVVQTRTAPIGHDLSRNSAVATEFGDVRISINTDDSDVLRIDGVVSDLQGQLGFAGGSLTVTGNSYRIDYDSCESLTVVDFGNHLNVTFCPDVGQYESSLQGLLGSFDGDSTNDLATRDGSTVFWPTITFDE